MTILLVRHARAGRRDRWKGDDRLRPLSTRGARQAKALPAILEPWTARSHGRARLISSPWTRCIQTLEPLRGALSKAGEAGLIVKLGIETDDRLGEGGGPKAVESLGAWLAGRPTVLCTHGDVIGEILHHLARTGVALGPEPGAAKGSVWVLDGTAGAVSTASYLPPPN